MPKIDVSPTQVYDHLPHPVHVLRACEFQHMYTCITFRLLCEQLCSLNPSEDRLTFTVEWIMNAEGDILEEWFGRSIIRSCVKLAYEHAQSMLDSPKKVFFASTAII